MHDNEKKSLNVKTCRNVSLSKGFMQMYILKMYLWINKHVHALIKKWMPMQKSMPQTNVNMTLSSLKTMDWTMTGTKGPRWFLPRLYVPIRVCLTIPANMISKHYGKNIYWSLCVLWISLNIFATSNASSLLPLTFRLGLIFIVCLKRLLLLLLSLHCYCFSCCCCFIAVANASTLTISPLLFCNVFVDTGLI